MKMHMKMHELCMWREGGREGDQNGEVERIEDAIR